MIRNYWLLFCFELCCVFQCICCQTQKFG